MVEFVYPKAEAVAIAKSNQSKVPAIDPASEGKVADKSLSKDDMEVVTLWLLSSTTVGPNDTTPAIKAEKYQQVASNEPPPQPAQQVQQSPRHVRCGLRRKQHSSGRDSRACAARS